MTRSRYKIYNPDQPHFLTMTIVEWIPLFMDKELAAIILRSLQFLQQKRNIKLYAYVIMENHLHIVASCHCLDKTIKEFKSFTARSIIDHLKGKNSHFLLKKLQRAKLLHKTESVYQVWQEGSHPQEIFSEKMLIQKIEYIHNNPIRRGYVDQPAYWRYSSAGNYEGLSGLLDIVIDWRNGAGL